MLVPGFDTYHIKCQDGTSSNWSSKTTDLSGASGDCNPVGATAVFIGVTWASLVVGPLGRSKLIWAAAVIR